MQLTINLALSFKNVFHRGTKFFGKTYVILEVNSLENFKVLSCLVYLKLTMTWGINIFFEKLTSEIGGESEKHPLHTMLLGVGISCKTCLLF